MQLESRKALPSAHWGCGNGARQTVEEAEEADWAYRMFPLIVAD
ncbi:hypothetical protein N184_23135 [Sinorhizobium sp. GL28]|nr:hypothetical protein N184_23135 [Sinorhizobium sp. GL28]